MPATSNFWLPILKNSETDLFCRCACDVPSHWYSLSTELNPDWTAVFSGQPEIKKYWDFVFKKHGLAEKTKFSTLFVGAVWSEERQNYEVEFKDLVSGKEWKEEFEVFISGMGGLSVPIDRPAGMKGVEDFQGEVFHSARWRHDVSLAGKRVGVIGASLLDTNTLTRTDPYHDTGNGCSASQFVPIIAEDRSTEVLNFVRSVLCYHSFDSKLTMRIDRTPNYYMPRPQANYSAVTKWTFRNVPGVMRAYRNFIASASDLRYVVWQLNWAPLRHYVEEVRPFPFFSPSRTLVA